MEFFGKRHITCGKESVQTPLLLYYIYIEFSDVCLVNLGTIEFGNRLPQFTVLKAERLKTGISYKDSN